MLTTSSPAGDSTTRLSERVVDQFLELMASGRLAPGDRLPTERELAAQFEVGRNSVREALRVLESLGVVESRHGDGTYVREPDSGQLMTPFRLALGLSAREAGLADVLAFRRILEPGSAALAAVNLDNEGRDRLARSLRRFDRTVEGGGDGDTPEGPAADTDFHFTIALATRNPLVIGVQRALQDILTQFRSGLAPSSYEVSKGVTRGHQAVFGAIVAGDPDAAFDAMQRHLDDVAAALPGDVAGRG